MLRRPTAHIRRKSEVLPASSEHFNPGEICGEGRRDDKEWRGTGISLTVDCPLPGRIYQEGFFPLCTDVPKILLPNLMLKTCPKQKILLLCYLLSCDYEHINRSES